MCLHGTGGCASCRVANVNVNDCSVNLDHSYLLSSGGLMPALYGVSELQSAGGRRVSDLAAEVISADQIPYRDTSHAFIPQPAILTRPVAGIGRPSSPGTIEKIASMLRSLSYIANRPPGGEAPAERSAAFAAVASSLRQDVRSDQLSRLATVAPDLAQRLQTTLLAGCGALLGDVHPDGGFEWASSELADLAKHLPPATSAVFPGVYYYEIFAADVAELGRALDAMRRSSARRRALAAELLTVLARPGVGAAEVHGAGRAAAEAGLAAEAAAARCVGELIEREERSRLAHEAAAAEAREARRAQKEAEAATARESRYLADEKHRRSHLADELKGVRAALVSEEQTRRKVEAASVATLQELRAQEDARWEAERQLKAEIVRCTQLEGERRRSEEEWTERLSGAEAREVRATAEAKSALGKYVDAEKMRVALQGRVSALDGVKAQLEQQLSLEREACSLELGLRQKAEAALADAMRAHAAAQQSAAEAVQAAEVARAALANTTSELAAAEERLRVANDGSLELQMAASGSEDALGQLKALRSEDAEKMMRLTSERASLRQKVDELEQRISTMAAAAERAEGTASKQRYELQAQLTEVHRRCEDLMAQATRSELMLAHERETGLTATDHEKRLQMQLDNERRAKQVLQQQLAAEAALRQKSDAHENASTKELQARLREAELNAQRLQAVQQQLLHAREEARTAREALGDAQARALKMERERDTEREEYKRERARRGELERQRDERPALPGQAVPLNAQPRRARTPPSLLQPQPPPPPPRGGIPLELAVPLPPAAALSRGAPMQLGGGGGPSVADELSRSDLWNFSSGAVGRGARPNGSGAPGTALPRISQPFNTVAATSLAPEEARALYGNSWVDDDA